MPTRPARLCVCVCVCVYAHACVSLRVNVCRCALTVMRTIQSRCGHKQRTMAQSAPRVPLTVIITDLHRQSAWSLHSVIPLTDSVHVSS